MARLSKSNGNGDGWSSEARRGVSNGDGDGAYPDVQSARKGGFFGNPSKGGSRSALSGPPYHSGARYDPHGSGPQTPRDVTSRAHLEGDSWDEPCGAPSETPRPKG